MSQAAELRLRPIWQQIALELAGDLELVADLDAVHQLETEEKQESRNRHQEPDQ